MFWFFFALKFFIPQCSLRPVYEQGIAPLWALFALCLFGRKHKPFLQKTLAICTAEHVIMCSIIFTKEPKKAGQPTRCDGLASDKLPSIAVDAAGRDQKPALHIFRLRERQVYLLEPGLRYQGGEKSQDRTP